MSSPPLRILYHHRIAASDGMRVHLSEMVNALRNQGHLVEVVGPGSEAAPAAEGARGSRLERLADLLRRGMPAAAFEVLELLYNVPAYLRLSRAAKTFRPDVIYERYNLFLLAGLLYRRRHRTPLLLEVNSPLAAERAAFGALQLKPLARLCEESLWRGADVVLSVTGVLAREVESVRGGAGGVHVTPNGFNLEKRPSRAAAAAARLQIGAPDDALLLGFIGFVRSWHGVGWAVEALPDLPALVHLVIVGDGPARPELEQRARELGMSERVHFVGRVAHERAPAYMQAFDLALQPASVAYASPLKLFEYMGLGRAIIAPDQPNIREVLIDGENALLFKAGDENAFRTALERLCQDGALRARLGAGALRSVEETPLTWANNARRLAALSRELLGLRRAAGRKAAGASAARLDPKTLG